MTLTNKSERMNERKSYNAFCDLMFFHCPERTSVYINKYMQVTKYIKTHLSDTMTQMLSSAFRLATINILQLKLISINIF
jgi:hypothetical protein